MKSNPKAFSTIISSTTETALQRSIIINEHSIIDGKEVTWLDIELPVDTHSKARRRCIDLIGKTDDEYIICELKFGKDSATDPPYDAKAEVESYMQAIKYNHEELDKNNNIHHTNGKPFYWKDVAEKGRPIIAANDSYWKYWREHRKVHIPSEISCYSLNIDVSYFKQLKKDNVKYEPTIKDLIWTRIQE